MESPHIDYQRVAPNQLHCQTAGGLDFYLPVQPIYGRPDDLGEETPQRAA